MSMLTRQECLDEIKEYYKAAVKDAISINRDALYKTAREMVKNGFEVPDWRLPVYPKNDDEVFVRHLLVSASINFCFTNLFSGEKFSVRWPHNAQKPWAGSTGMHAALMRAREEGFDVYNPDILQDLSEREINHIFRPEGSVIPLRHERLYNMREAGYFLKSVERKYGNLIGYMESLDFDAERIVSGLSRQMPRAFGDDYTDVEHEAKWYRLVFDKRARLFAIMYQGRARSSEGKLPLLHNIEAIGPVVDYQIPRTLRHLGILEYNTHIAILVDRAALIPEQSRDELAIRTATYIAVEELNTIVNEMLQTPIGMVEIDFPLWLFGRKAEGKHHLTSTAAY